MAKKTTQLTMQQWLQQSAVRVGRAYFYLSVLYVAIIIMYDAFKLITPDVLLERWTMASILLAVTGILWFLSRTENKGSTFYSALIYGYVGLGIALASFSVFTQRGVASRAVALYVIPLIVSAFVLRRAAIFTTAVLSVAAYSLSAIRYAALNPSEGYKAQLYGEVGFYSALFFIVALLLWGVVRSKSTDSA